MNGVTRIVDATCLACGCLCDDIALSIENNRIAAAEKACPIGERWFLADRPINLPQCRIEGQPASADEAYARAADILAAAKAPLFQGLCSLTCEAQGRAISLADRLGGRVRLSTSDRKLDQAIRAVGIVTATLGEVRHRADLVIFWGADPATTHPRHFERYSLEPRGEFVPNGRGDRTCVVIDSRATATSGAADTFLQLRADADELAIDMLRKLIEGADNFDEAHLERQTGIRFEDWRNLSLRMRSARYGALFFDTSLVSESLLMLVRDLNRHTRFVCLPLGAPGNSAGAKQVLAWQTGNSIAVDFSDGCPRQGDFPQVPDAVVEFMCDPAVDKNALEHSSTDASLQGVPIVLLHSVAVVPRQDATVTFAVATPGIDAAGTVFRCDGVPLPLRPGLALGYPTTEQVLESLERRISVSSRM